jgi:hypothetical protein
MNQFIYAGEIPPREMLEMLTVQWKLPHDLAYAFVNLYGGHVYDVFEGIKQFFEKGEKFEAYDPFMTSNVQKCLKWKNGDKKLMVSALKQLANTGFYPLKEYDDPLAEKISEYNVGGVVKRNSLIVGLNENVWKKTHCKYGIVPSKQSMRLVIAEVLYDENLLDDVVDESLYK